MLAFGRGKPASGSKLKKKNLKQELKNIQAFSFTGISVKFIGLFQKYTKKLNVSN